LLGASHPLTAPIRVELDVVAVGQAPRSTLTIYFGDQSVVVPVTGTAANPGRVVVEFATGEGILRTGAFPWGADNANDPIGRVGLQAVRIFEDSFTGSWITYPVDFEFDFPNLPYGYTEANLVTRTVQITNVGSEPTDVSANVVGGGFTIVQQPTNLGVGETTTIGIRPIAGLSSGLHEATLVVTGDNTLNIPVSVVVNNPLGLPDSGLFYAGNPTSTTNQFPTNTDEDIDWGHGFRRISFTEGSHLMRFNGQVRDADASLAIPFMLNDVLWVPLAAAQLALPNTTWNVNAQGGLVVSYGTATYNGYALIATQAVNGGNATFVPLQNIANAIGVGNIGWDERSETLIVVTGAAVEQNNVLYNNINNRPEQWYGSPNSLAIATNFVYMQRANGGWPRGIGQINALPHQPDVGGMSPQVVQNIALAFNADDSYFGRGITTNETRFLLRMYEATGIERFRVAGLRGFDTIIRLQDRNGGWPYQISGGSYHRAISISDNAINNILWLMMDIERDNIFSSTLGQERVAQAITSLENGMNWILSTQVRSTGFADGVERLTAWPMAVYQYGVENFTLQPGATPGVAGRPAWQREFEPPSINGNESVDIIRFLMSIPNPSEAIREAIHAAVYFFEYIRIEGYHLNHATGLDPLLGRNIVPTEGARPLWPRFICPETFTPLFYDRTEPMSPEASPHQLVNRATFIANNGEWLGFSSGFISANATVAAQNSPVGQANAVRAGTRRNLYRDENNVLSTNASGTFDLVASFHNLSFERRMGFNYINHFAETLPAEYQEWLLREGLIEPPPTTTPPMTTPPVTTPPATTAPETTPPVTTPPATTAPETTPPVTPPTPTEPGTVPPTPPPTGNGTAPPTHPPTAPPTGNVTAPPTESSPDEEDSTRPTRPTTPSGTAAPTVVLDPVLVEVDFTEEEILELLNSGEAIIIETDYGYIYLPNDLLYSLIDVNNPQELKISLEIVPSPEENQFFKVTVEITLGGEIVSGVSIPYTVAISLDSFDLVGINYYRIVAVLEDGTIIGGRFDSTTGMFIFETTIVGEFTIAYVAELQRLILTLDGYNIIDLADNTTTQVMDVLPVIYQDRVLVPIRFIANALNTQIGWNPDTAEITLSNNDTVLVFRTGEIVDGMDVPAQNIQDRTMVPTRFVAEFFGAIVNWDGNTRTIEIIK
jgi:PelA/Pel-15E family pectate lyase